MDGVALAHFQIHGRAVGAAGPVVFGKGNLVAWTIISEGGIRLDGNVAGVTYTSSNPLNLELGGNASQFTARTRGLGKVAVKGSLDMDDGQGGWIVFREPLFEAGSKTYTFDGRPGLYSATCAGDRILFQVSTAGGKTAAQVINFLDQSKLTGNAGTGQLVFDNKGITATFVGTGDWFTVRRLGL